ncbi:MAG: chloride channel protein [Spirochaetota bacterium]|nr:chloride channel protein [Spirochaetota bacterium]
MLFNHEIFNKYKNNFNNIIFTRLKDLYLKSEISFYIFHIFFSLVVGILAGIGAILFHYLLDKMELFFKPSEFIRFFSISDIFIFVIPVIGGIAIAFMIKLFPGVAKERGVVSVIKSLIINNGYIPIKSTIFHFIAPIISIGTGAPLGPEGPAARIGSGLGSYMSQLLRFNNKDMRMYTASGAGAAISAIFNAPIAGVFFGIEVILQNNFKSQALSGLILSSVVSDIISRTVLGNRHIFTIADYRLNVFSDFSYFLLFGIVCGIVSLTYFLLSKLFRKLFDKFLWLRNEFIGLIIVSSVFGIFLIEYNDLYGVGYNTINNLINHNIAFDIIISLLILKIVFLALFHRAGAFGGTFAPSLSIGALLGYSFSYIINIIFNINLDPITFSLVGMGGVLAGINSIPLTSLMLVFEVTNDYRFILPLMLVSIISYLVVIYINKGSVYSIELLEEKIDVSERGEIDLLGKIKVKELQKTDYEVVNYQMPFRELIGVMINSNYGDIIIVNDKNQLQGIVSLKEIRQAFISNELVDLLIAGDITLSVPVVSEDDPVSLAIKKIEKNDIDSIPVVNNNDKTQIVGILTHQDIIHAYNRMLEAWETDQFLINYSYRKL